MPAVTLSPDGRWWWNGQAWQPAVSADGRFRWDGTAWRPLQPVAMALRPTAWTVPLQRAAAALLGILIAYSAIAIPISFTTMGNQAALATALTSSSLSDAEIAQVTRTVETTLVTVGIVAAVLGVAWNGVLLVGSLKRWRWVFWYLMIVGLLAGLNLLYSPVAYLASLSTPSDLAPFRVPGWTYAAGFLLSAANLALGIWFLVALRRYGAWACVRTPEAAQPGA